MTVAPDAAGVRIGCFRWKITTRLHKLRRTLKSQPSIGEEPIPGTILTVHNTHVQWRLVNIILHNAKALTEHTISTPWAIRSVLISTSKPQCQNESASVSSPPPQTQCSNHSAKKLSTNYPKSPSTSLASPSTRSHYQKKPSLNSTTARSSKQQNCSQTHTST